ncbi:MAG TPA: NnrU family protein [Candidatus Macondimonas sp.]|nr:NnrU family protein [Candidatus Macondimonas sp.]
MPSHRALPFAIAAYILFLLSLVGLVLFLHDLWLPWTAGTGELSGGWGRTLAINTGLIALFGLQHSIMARPAFKRRWTRLVPEHLERSTYVAASSLALIILMGFWQPMPGVIWHISWQPAVTLCLVLLGFGLVISLWSTFLTDHFDLFGLRQAYLHDQGLPYTPVPFKMGLLYRYVRHPMMLGMLLLFWVTPYLTVGHLFLASGLTLYILIGVHYEERDLMRHLGPDYVRYRETTPMLFPRFARAAPMPGH